MKEIDGFEQVVTTVRTSARGVEPDSYMLCYESMLMDGPDDDEQDHPIGRLHWRRFALGAALVDRQDEYEVFDAVDSDTEHLFHMIFDAKRDHRPPFDNVTVMDVVYIDRFELLIPEYSEQEVAEELIERQSR